MHTGGSTGVGRDPTDVKTIRVRVLLFAQFRELLGGRVQELAVPMGTTSAELLAQVAAGHPRLEALQRVTRFIVNNEFVAGDHLLSAGDEIAFVPPVAGGQACTA